MSLNATARLATEKADFRPALLSCPIAGFLPEKTMISYREQWKDPRWQRKRLEVMEAAGWKCENCGDDETTLNVHHKHYIKGRMVWEYDASDLACLCEPCHEQDHADRQTLNLVLSSAGPGQLDRVIGLVVGYLDADCTIDPTLANGARGTDARRQYYEIGVASSLVEAHGQEFWRKLIRDFHSSKPTTPTIANLIDEWDHGK